MTIIFASRLVAYKNLAFVYSAIAEMKKANTWPKDTKFVVMGSGPEELHLRELIAKLNLENEVVMLGSVSEERVLEEAKNCALALAPALTEFSPNYVLRAIRETSPFLISCEHGLAFRVPEEFMFEARDEDEFISKLSWILSHKDEAKLLVMGIRTNQTWDFVIEKNVELINNLLLA